MSVAIQHDWWISPEEYLQGEELADTKHEYVGGMVYAMSEARIHAMSGARIQHNRIAGNIYLETGSQLRGKRCEPFNSTFSNRSWGTRSKRGPRCPGL